MTIFFRVGFCVFQAWGCKFPSRNIRQFFWKIYRGFFGLGAGYIPKRYEKFFVEKDKCFQGNFFVFWWSLYSLPSNHTSYQLRTKKWKWDLLHLQLHWTESFATGNRYHQASWCNYITIVKNGGNISCAKMCKLWKWTNLFTHVEKVIFEENEPITLKGLLDYNHLLHVIISFEDSSSKRF